MKITNYNLILGSSSPRRKEILENMGIDFTIRTSEKDEIFPKNLKTKKVSVFLAQQKSENLFNSLSDEELLITADTVVIKNNMILGKPKNKTEAKKMLQTLSNSNHEVITSVCLTSLRKSEAFSEKTIVYFSALSIKMIDFYIEKYNPFDKAGSYGIQEWLGLVSISRIEGSYTNVVGLPSSKLYEKIRNF